MLEHDLDRKRNSSGGVQTIVRVWGRGSSLDHPKLRLLTSSKRLINRNTLLGGATLLTILVGVIWKIIALIYERYRLISA